MSNYYKKEGIQKLVAALNVFLADTAIVYYKTHGFHWNMEDDNFYSLHIMFEKFYKKLWKSMDDTAERIRTLGEKIPTNYVALLRNATIEEIETIPQSQGMVRTLRDDYFALAQKAYEVYAIASAYGDFVTTDMMIKRAAFLEKAAWMLHSTMTR